MPFIDRSQAFERFKKDASNSSHFVWFLDELQYFESSEDKWVFGFRTVGSTTLISLEPLIPGAPQSYEPEHHEAFRRAWKEFCEVVNPKICAFVAVYDPFQSLLAQNGFQSLKIGQEPWVDLSDCIPKGNAGKGVRAARNQALHAGVTVEEWKADEILADPSKRETIGYLFGLWKDKRIVNLSGFLNATDPFAHATERRYFVAKSKEGEVQGYLIATPVGGIQGYFLEDMVLKPHAERGSGELLTLETLIKLSESGSKVASLGVVSVTSIDVKCSHGLPEAMQLLMIKLPQALQKLYNFNGLETFRKRFKPNKWANIHLAVQNRAHSGVSDSKAWLLSLVALARAFRPKVRLTTTIIKDAVLSPWQKHPISWGMVIVSLLLFSFINHGGPLPQWAIDRFGFSANVPVWEWFYRTITSDFLYFDPVHFWVWGTAFFAVIRWSETSHSRRFVLSFFCMVTYFDDLLNYVLVIRPFAFLRPDLYHRLIEFKDVGGSLGLVAFIGLQICQLRKNRELIFAAVVLSVVLGFVFKSLHFQTFVLNLNHFIFLVLGYIAGKVKYEIEQRKHKLASKNKPPTAKSVAGSQPARKVA